MHKEWLILGGTLIACLHIAGCSTTANTGQHFTMTGTPDGIRAFGDTLVGSMKTAKESSDANSQYFASRAEFEKNVTARELSPKGFFQKLFGKETSNEK